MQTTIAGIRDGQTVILCGGVKKEKQVVVNAAGERKEEGEIARETLIILTPHRVKGDAVRPASAVMPTPAPTMPVPCVIPATAPCPAVLPAPAMPTVAPTTAPQGWFLPALARGRHPPTLPRPSPARPNGGICPHARREASDRAVIGNSARRHTK